MLWTKSKRCQSNKIIHFCARHGDSTNNQYNCSADEKRKKNNTFSWLWKICKRPVKPIREPITTIAFHHVIETYLNILCVYNRDSRLPAKLRDIAFSMKNPRNVRKAGKCIRFARLARKTEIFMKIKPHFSVPMTKFTNFSTIKNILLIPIFYSCYFQSSSHSRNFFNTVFILNKSNKRKSFVGEAKTVVKKLLDY